MKNKKIDAHAVLQELIKRLGGHYSIKFAVTDDYQQRVIVRDLISGEEKLNIPVYDEVIDPFDVEEINQKIIQTFLN